MMLWSFVPHSQFTRPPEPAREAALGRVRGLLQRIGRKALAARPVSVQAELRSASLKLLDRVAPAPRWGAAERSLEFALSSWSGEQAPQQNLQIIVGPPGAGTTTVVQRWAERNQYRLVQPPPYRQLIEGSTDWLHQLDGDDPLALPNLECFFARHYRGVDAMRRLVDRVCNGSRRIVVGCNSWAWSFLSRTVRINALLPEPFVLVAFDAARLQQWLYVLAQSTAGCSLSFRLTDDGSHVLPAVENCANADSGDLEDQPAGADRTEKPSSFLEQLAARSRGNPLVAWAQWRQCLHTSKDDDVDEDAQEAASGDNGRTIWVRPWSDVAMPEVPANTAPEALMLLHTLLLHDGLPADLLDLLLPASLGGIMEQLYRLRSAGLVKLESGVWRVTLLGYPSVRATLAGEDYLVDGF